MGTIKKLINLTPKKIKNKIKSTVEWKNLEEKNVVNSNYQIPSDAIELNSSKTIDVLMSSSIEYYAVPGRDKFRSVFAVGKTDRKIFIKALMKCKELPEVRIIEPRSKLPKPTFNVRDRASRDLLENSSVVRLTWHSVRVADGVISGEEFGTEIEFWDDPKTQNPERLFHDEWISPRQNRFSSRVRADDGICHVPLSTISRFQPKFQNQIIVPTFESMTHKSIADINFDIDVVFTWVDSNDPLWQTKKNSHRPDDEVHTEAASDARYINRDELKYALRSIKSYAPWVRKIFIVTDNQIPEWLDTSNESVEIVSHDQIFGDRSHLPTFNSHAIEAHLHHISGLSENFLYLNDDMFFGQPVTPDQFFMSNGSAKHFLSQSRVPFFEKTIIDTPVDQAVKNSRIIIERKFSVEQSQVFEHAPYALTKTVLSEIERENSQEVIATSRNKFRSSNDLNIPSHLAHHWGYMTGKSVPGRISFSYIGLSHAEVATRLKRLLARKNVDAFCINDTFTSLDELEQQNKMLSDFFNEYFPIKGDWEK